MKKVLIGLLLVGGMLHATAQSDDEAKGFKKENLFVGGDLTASFSNYATVLGISPYFGYSLNKYVDVALSTNFNYTSQRDYFEYGDKLRQTVYGAGAFTRLYPVKFLFAQAEYQHNFIRNKYIPADNGSYAPAKQTIDANSFLIGAGYAGGREGKGSSYYYLSIMWDVAKVAESPYVDGLGRALPIIRAGYNIALFQGGGDGGRRRRRY